MSELSLQNQAKKFRFSSFMSDLSHFFSFIQSHRYHYFSYFIFFSPFFLKLLSFLSPLLITTTFFLLAFLTISLTKNQESHVGFLLSTYNNIVETFKSNGSNESEQELYHLEELEVYKLLFETCMHEVEENPLEVLEVRAKEKIVHAIEPTVEEFSRDSGNTNFKSVRNLDENAYGTAFDCYDKFMACEPNSMEENSTRVEAKLCVSNEDVHQKVGETDGALCPNLVSVGSVRDGKELRTLTCKVFEERHNVHADHRSEGMDILWETKESDESVNVGQANAKKGTMVETNYIELDEDFDDDLDVQVSCLHAFKFSPARMNMGMRSPSLRKMSKAFKRIGWLHRVSRHGKKVPH